jgi:ABC-type amino acid transport substrate-binding protein
MKRMAVILTGLLITATLGAQELTIGTIEGTANYGPLIMRVLKETGINAKIVTYRRQDDLYPALARGTVDGAFFLAEPIIAQLNGAVTVPVRLHQTNFCAVTLDPKVKVTTPGDLRRYTVGVVKGQMAHDALTRGMPTVSAVSDMEQFKMLAAGRFQIALAVEMAVPFHCAAAGIKTYYIQQPPLLMSPTFLALSKKQAGLTDKVTAVFKQWLENGRWNEALAAVDAEAAKKR